MSLLISDVSQQLIDEFARSVGASTVYVPFKISVNAEHISIIFAQSERYSQLVNCEVMFSSDVSFFYEEILAAFSVGADSNAGRSAPEIEYAEEIKRNDEYVLEVIEFCRAHWGEIIKIPPYWYEKAVEISYRSIRSNFPAIADEDRRNKIRLLNTWRDRTLL